MNGRQERDREKERERVCVYCITVSDHNASVCAIIVYMCTYLEIH